jgi:guanylate cyclase soluble subunit beta
MLGWINDCVEKLVLTKFGVDVWHTIKEKAGCEVEDGGFYKLDAYPDQTTVDLVMAAVHVSGLTAEAILETFGAFFVQYVRDEGYDNLLRCQGSNLKDFMANINAMHQHLQNTFPNKMTMPQFWVEDDASEDGTLLLHYQSKRGSLLAPVAKGVMTEIASDQFGFEIKMERLSTQGEDGAEHTRYVSNRRDVALYMLTVSSSEDISNLNEAGKCQQ